MPLNIVVIGASTGGCAVMVDILSSLPPLPIAITIVQHIRPYIINQYFQTLALQANMPVHMVNDGMWLKNGAVFIAPPGRHLQISGNRHLHLSDGPPVNYVSPSIDVVMKSLDRPLRGTVTGVLLTGMGRDGAAGIQHIKEHCGGVTIAQNQESCTVFGMPQKAIATGCVDFVLAPDAIVDRLCTMFTV